MCRMCWRVRRAAQAPPPIIPATPDLMRNPPRAAQAPPPIIPATPAPTREAFTAISVSLRVASLREPPARLPRNNARKRRDQLEPVCLRSLAAQVARLAQAEQYT